MVDSQAFGAGILLVAMATLAAACGCPLDPFGSGSARTAVTGLVTTSDPFEGSSGKLRCQFTEPATAPARVHLDTALGLVRGPVLVAEQFVDLREPQAAADLAA